MLSAELQCSVMLQWSDLNKYVEVVLTTMIAVFVDMYVSACNMDPN